MSFGKMNLKIDIYTVENITDDSGFVHESPKLISSTISYMEQKHGTKKWANLSSYTTADALFRFRFIPYQKISPGLFISCELGEYEVISVERVNQMYLEVLAKRIVPVSV